ncbi:MAG: 2-C-methyl-D-erythritol 4-phosphate cytidylyltransferase [Treponema sp.]|nr:2-C-methyl-D-erythritol 4-phosphate cytidylyltransferase [Treponema sp.]MCL2237347.1 2-C-methyl-D-erythritol 4-phosphate cytidylyltransferase [Treponema sp.]
MSGEHVGAIILAAGSSNRMGGIKKEYRMLENGKTVLASSVCAFFSVPVITIIVIAVPENGEEAARNALPPECFSVKDRQILFVRGGSTRRESAYNALLLLADYAPNYVLIHDGARPWASCSLMERLIKAVREHGAAIPVLPVTDTPKELSEDGGFVRNHPKRANTRMAQTPQAFKFPQILHAHKKAAKTKNEEFTDDAQIWGKFMGRVAVIPGETENKKITFPEDLS